MGFFWIWVLKKKKKKKSRNFSYFYHFSFAKWPTLTIGSKFYLQGNPSYNVPQSHHHQHPLFRGYQDRMWNHVPSPANKAFYKRKSSKSWVFLTSVPGCLLLSGPRLVDDTLQCCILIFKSSWSIINSMARFRQWKPTIAVFSLTSYLIMLLPIDFF